MTTWGAGLHEQTVEDRITELERQLKLMALCITDILDHLNRHSDTDAQQAENLPFLDDTEEEARRVEDETQYGWCQVKHFGGAHQRDTFCVNWKPLDTPQPA